MKRVVFIVEVIEKGVGKHIIDLFSILENTEAEIFVLYGTERIEEKYVELIEKNKDRFIKVNNLHKNIGINDIKSIFEIKKILKNIKPDVVHCHSSKAGLSGRIAAKLAKVKKIYYSPHAYFFLKYKEKTIKRYIFLLAEKILSRIMTSCTIATSNGEKQAFEQNNIDKKEKCILIEHGIQLLNIENEKIQAKKQELGIQDNQKVIGVMARLEEQKDPVIAIKIMENIIKRNENTVGILFGSGSMKHNIEEIYNNMPSTYQDRIKIAGETQEPDLSIAMMDIYLTTSLYEGLPYTLLTALGYGKPILGTNVEGNRDCIIEGINGFTFKVKDIEKATEMYEKIINENLISKMGEESKKIYQKRFSIEKMKEQYQKLYLEEFNE